MARKDERSKQRRRGREHLVRSRPAPWERRSRNALATRQGRPPELDSGLPSLESMGPRKRSLLLRVVSRGGSVEGPPEAVITVVIVRALAAVIVALLVRDAAHPALEWLRALLP